MYALHPISLQLPRRCLSNSSSHGYVRLTDDGLFSMVLSRKAAELFLSPLGDRKKKVTIVTYRQNKVWDVCVCVCVCVSVSVSVRARARASTEEKGKWTVLVRFATWVFMVRC